MSDFRKALMITAFSIAALSLIGMDGRVLTPGFGVIVYLLAVFLVVVAIIVAIVFYFKGRRSIASGMLAGIGIGIVALGVSCFALWRV